MELGHAPLPIDVADFLWHEVWLHSLTKSDHFPLAPYIHRVIDHFATAPIQKPVVHHEWIPKKGSSLYAGGPHPSVTVASTSLASRRAKPMAEPLRRIARFLGKSQQAIFKACTANATDTHELEVRRVTQA